MQPAIASHVRQSVLEALKQTLATGVQGNLVDSVVHALRTTEYGLSDLLSDCAALKAQAGDQTSNAADTLEKWRRLDALTTAALRETSCVHEAVLETTARSYAELDGAGRVIYANRSLLKLVPDIVNRDLTDYFDAKAGEGLRGMLAAGHKTSVRRMALHTPEGEVPISAEFGPIHASGEPPKFYAMIGDVRASLQAELAAMEATELGVIHLRDAHTIGYANGAAVKFLGTSAQSLKGQQFSTLLGTDELPLVQHLEDNLGRGTGFSKECYFLRNGKPPLPVRLFVIPQFGPQREKAEALLVFRSMEIEVARERIHRACEQRSDPKKLLHQVLEIVGELVPYDVASFGIYTEDMHHFRTLYVEPLPPTAWPNRWFEIPDALIDWIKQDKLWVSDFETFLKEKPGTEKLYNNEVVQGYLSQGIKSFISIRVWDGERVESVLTLVSKTPDKYSREDFDLLKRLPIEQAMRIASEAIAQQRRDFVRKTLKAISRAKDNKELADIVILRLATFFKWDHVSILKVNRFRKRFEMVAQVDRSRGKFSVAADYTQPLKHGMLGKSLKEGRALWIDDTKVDPLPHPYIRICDASRSSLCVPIALDGTITWMLNVETKESHAFYGPDVEAATAVLTELSRSLDKIFQAALMEETLKLMDQGVVVVDAKGEIRHANFAAMKLLGAFSADLRGKRFDGFAPDNDPNLKAILADERDERKVMDRHVSLRGLDGKMRPMIVSLRRPRDEYDHQIWLLTDSEQRNWKYEFRYLREVANEVAQQTRLPLMIASTLASKCRRLLDDGSAQDLLDQAVRHLAKVDISYERLSAGLETHKGDSRSAAGVDLRSRLEVVLDALPDDDRKQVHIDAKDPLPKVRADADTIDFILRSILQYLLSRKPLDRKIVVKECAAGDGASLHLAVPDTIDLPPMPRPDDSLSEFQRDAKAMAALNPEAITKIIEALGGHAILPDVNGHALSDCEIWLPVVDPSGAPR